MENLDTNPSTENTNNNGDANSNSKSPIIYKRPGRVQSSFLRTITKNHIIAALLLCFAGALLISISYLIPETKNKLQEFLRVVLRDWGIAIFPLGIVSLIYEILLRRDFLNDLAWYENIRSSGINDIYDRLKLDKLANDLDKIHNTEIRIIDISIANFDGIKESIITAINERKCKVKILLWNPQEVEALKSRARSLCDGSKEIDLIDSIINNLKIISNIITRVNNSKDFEVKLYTSFIAVSFVGFGDEILIGHYLRNKKSSNSTQLRISGRQHHFFNELDEHFNSLWEDVNNEKFDTNKLENLKVWFLDYQIKHPLSSQ